jgi:2-oxoglutarate ferredoxin oxidoreductase subunit alpha
VPIVVVDVMRGGPSTGIPAKSEQSDLSFAVGGLPGDAPRSCWRRRRSPIASATTQWAVHLAEALQAPAIVSVRPVHGPVSARSSIGPRTRMPLVASG